MWMKDEAGVGHDGRTGVGPVVPRRWALFLDIDGTLLHIAETPQGVRVDPDLCGLMSRLFEASQGALALISGRTIAEIDRIFTPMRFPAGGQHGLERRDSTGGMHRDPLSHEELTLVRIRLAALQRDCPGLMMEDKGQTLAIHFRQAPEFAKVAEQAVYDALVHLGYGWTVQPGKMVFEIKPTGKDKGSTITEFMAEPPFRGRTPVFIGDDATDEYGFAVVNGLGGVSVKVGGGATAARWQISNVEAVRSWLELCLLKPIPSEHGGNRK
jgi:trehalose 6-phosphate phosphatase